MQLKAGLHNDGQQGPGNQGLVGSEKIFISCLAGICWGPQGAHAGFNVPNDRAGDPLSKALRIVFPGFGE